MEFFEKVDALLSWLEEKILILSVFLMALILIGNVLLRNFFNSNINSTEEISQFLIVIVTFLGVSCVSRKGLHIRMSILSEHLAAKPRKILALFVSFCTFWVMLYLTWISYRYVARVAVIRRVSPILQLPLHYIWCVVPIGFALSAVQYLMAFLKNLRVDGVWLSFYVQDDQTGLAEKSTREGG